MTDFELYGSVKMAFCLTDGVNHVTDQRKVRRMFRRVYNYLDPGGIFIFDIIPEDRLMETMGNNVFYDIDEDISYVWQSKADKRGKVCEFELTFFIKQENGLYKREDTCIRERAYKSCELKSWLLAAGFSKVKVFNKFGRMYFIGEK